jgi:hypothetical protein
MNVAPIRKKHFANVTVNQVFILRGLHTKGGGGSMVYGVVRLDSIWIKTDNIHFSAKYN